MFGMVWDVFFQNLYFARLSTAKKKVSTSVTQKKTRTFSETQVWIFCGSEFKNEGRLGIFRIMQICVASICALVSGMCLQMGA